MTKWIQVGAVVASVAVGCSESASRSATCADTYRTINAAMQARIGAPCIGSATSQDGQTLLCVTELATGATGEYAPPPSQSSAEGRCDDATLVSVQATTVGPNGIATACVRPCTMSTDCGAHEVCGMATRFSGEQTTVCLPTTCRP